MGPLWSSTSSHNVGLSATTVHRATPPLNPQQGNDWETWAPNKCPFVIRAQKLWSHHKLILVSKGIQTTWILSPWSHCAKSEVETETNHIKSKFWGQSIFSSTNNWDVSKRRQRINCQTYLYSWGVTLTWNNMIQISALLVIVVNYKLITHLY